MDNSLRTIAVTGAGGFVGRRVVEHFADQGWRVRAFQRSPQGPPRAGISRHEFCMPDRFDARAFEGVEVIVHAAVQDWSPTATNADRVNLEGSRALVEVARSRGARIVFLSSLSAHGEARSHYGRSKLAVEQLFDPARDCVLRLGLVLDRDGGLFGSMVQTLRGARLLPMVGGDKPIQTIAMDDLLRVLSRVAGNGITGRYNVATSPASTMREFYTTIVDRLGSGPVFVPVPLTLVLAATWLFERLRLPAPVSYENALGLRYMRAFDTTADLEKIGIALEPMAESIERLLGTSVTGHDKG